jgi:hypothetical protein
MSMKTILMLAAATLAASTAHAECTNDDVQPFDDWLEGQRCSTAKTSNCLSPVTIHVCSSSAASYCPRYGYNYQPAWVGGMGRQAIHMTLNFMRELRKIAVRCPERTLFYRWSAAEGIHRNSFGVTLGDLLWHQTEIYLRDARTRFYDAARNSLPLSSVLTGNNVDPTKFDMVAFVNEGETAHAMTQADLGQWLLGVGAGLAENGHTSSIHHYLRLSERVFRAYGIPDSQGGVRNNRMNHRCYNNFFCYWFHSQEVETYNYPSTVLNQNLHAIRDAMAAHHVLADWRDHGMNGVPLPSEFNGPHIAQLKEWARGGLFQLARSTGNANGGPVVVGVTAPPPNLRELLNPIQVIGSVQRYAAHYAYRFHPSEPAPYGGVGIAPENTCHYHFHNLPLLATILGYIHGDDASPYFSSDSHFVGIYCKLLYNREAGTSQLCALGSSNLRGVPLAELYYGSLQSMTFHQSCDGVPDGEYADSRDFKATDPEERGEYENARAFFDAAYSGFTF